MSTYIVRFNPNWPHSEHIDLPLIFHDLTLARVALRTLCETTYGWTTTSQDGNSWKSNLNGSLLMGAHGDLNHGHIVARRTRREILSNRAKFKSVQIKDRLADAIGLLDALNELTQQLAALTDEEGSQNG